jgi:hypothetical protein
MHKQALILLSFLFLLSFGFTANAQGNAGTPTPSDCGPINQARLKELLVQLGHTVKIFLQHPEKRNLK